MLKILFPYNQTQHYGYYFLIKMFEGFFVFLNYGGFIIILCRSLHWDLYYIYLYSLLIIVLKIFTPYSHLIHLFYIVILLFPQNLCFFQFYLKSFMRSIMIFKILLSNPNHYLYYFTHHFSFFSFQYIILKY